MKSTKSSVRRHKRRRGRSGCPTFPPDIDQSISYTRTFRFYGTLSGSESFTFADLFDLYACATGTNTAVRMWSSVRVKRLRIWAIAATSDLPAASTTITWQWQTADAALGAPARLHVATTMGSTKPLVIETRPPKGSLAYQWLSTAAAGVDSMGAQNWFALTPNSALSAPFCTIDLTLQAVEANVFGGFQTRVSVNQTVSGLSNDELFLCPLDGNESSYFKPTSFVTA